MSIHVPEMQQGVPVEYTSIPLLGVRRSRIVHDPLKDEWFLGSAVVGPVAYRPDDQARCYEGTRHNAPYRTPNVRCTCGYYVIADPRNLSNHSTTPVVDMWVAMRGKVVEHEKGYRAEYLDYLHGSAQCFRCRRSATWLQFHSSSVTFLNEGWGSRHRVAMLSTAALCDGCQCDEERLLDITVTGYRFDFMIEDTRYMRLTDALGKLNIPYQEERYWEL